MTEGYALYRISAGRLLYWVDLDKSTADLARAKIFATKTDAAIEANRDIKNAWKIAPIDGDA